jgi:hypothetical protein
MIRLRTHTVAFLAEGPAIASATLEKRAIGLFFLHKLFYFYA